MATVSYKIYATKAAYVSEDAPTTNYHGGDYMQAAVTGNDTHRKIAYFKYEEMPSAVGKLIGSVSNPDGKITIWAPPNGELSSHDAAHYPRVGYLNSAWEETAVTFNNHPAPVYLGNSADQITVTQEIYEKIRQYGIAVYIEGFAGDTDVQIAYIYPGEPSNFVSFYLVDSIPIVTPISPLRKFVNSTEDTVFQWDYSNAYGDEQKSFEIQTSADGVTWTTLVTGTTSETSVTIPAGTLSALDKYWRIQVVSQYDYSSDWSAAIQIVVISPSVCSLDSATATPRPLARWFCEEQQAFQVKFGTIDSGTVYGTQKSFKCPVYLPDGEYAVAVRTQGSLGIWSQWSEQTISVTNIPGDEIDLTVYVSHHARLSWTGGEGGVFYVLRDGVPIAKTEETSFTDELATGRHTYQVLEQLADDNYTLSNKRTVILRAPCAIITPVSAVAWQNLKYSLEQNPTVGESHSQTAVLVHYVGRKYPVAEVSEFVDSTLSFDVAFKTQDDEKAFRALLGQIVCYKNKLGRTIIGLLTGVSVESDRWYSKCSCTITATDFTEEIDYE